jgi:hypothetical protein
MQMQDKKKKYPLREMNIVQLYNVLMWNEQKVIYQLHQIAYI